MASEQLNSKALEYSKLYHDTLINNIIPFWAKHSPDWVNGGYFTCLDREGKVFDTDKFVWLQARQVYMFSKLSVAYENKFPDKVKDWLKIASLGAVFLSKYAKDAHGNFYFSLTKAGKPITQPFSIFSDYFSALAFAWYYRASGETWAKDLALNTYDNIQQRQTNPKGQYNKAFPGTRQYSPLNVPMIDLNTVTEFLEAFKHDNSIDTQKLAQQIETNIKEILHHVDKEKQLFRELVSLNPEEMDTFEGRVNNPGHGLEALWFLMEAAERKKDKNLIQQCADLIIGTLEWGWDKQYGGIFYFLDFQGKPPQQLEWDQKLWWVHLEALVACALGYYLTGREDLANWYMKIHEYAWKHFHDPEFGEWWGYLNRRGEVLLSLKGGKWKGCFHVPRALYLCSNIFEKIALKQ